MRELWTVSLGLIGIVALMFVCGPPLTKEQAEQNNKRDIDSYIAWCKSINGDAVFDRYKKPYRCSTRG
jgi:hypothetical protein